MSASPPEQQGRRALKWAVIGAIEAGVISAVVFALLYGLILGSENWLQKAGYGALIGIVGGGIGGALYGGKRPPTPVASDEPQARGEPPKST
jgi:hypothetical protein